MLSRGQFIADLAQKKLNEAQKVHNAVHDDDELSSELDEEQCQIALAAEKMLEDEDADGFDVRVRKSRRTSSLMVRKYSYSISDDFTENVSSFFEDLDDTDKDQDYEPEDNSIVSSSDSDIVLPTPTKSCLKRKILSPNKTTKKSSLIADKAALFTEKLVNVDDLSSYDEDLDVTRLSSAEKITKKCRFKKEKNLETKKRVKGGVYSRRNRQERKEKRNMGKEYMTSKGKNVAARVSKPLRDCRMGCKKILEVPYHNGSKTYRELIFEEYWSLADHDKRVSYVSGLVDILTPKTKRPRTEDPEKPKFRQCTYAFHFQVCRKRIRVCKDCFVRTLGETNAFVNVTLSRQTNIGGTIEPDKRGTAEPANKHSEEKINAVIQHIKSFPKYKSHYSRRESDKYYLPAHLNLTILYDRYLETTSDPVSRKTYSDELHKLKISFKEPKIDTCDKCGVLRNQLQFEIDVAKKNELHHQLSIHQEEADFAYSQKREDKVLAKENNSSMRLYMFDLQQCLPTPCLTESVVFYKRQLWTYNLTMYESTHSSVKCYMWHEGEGARGGNQIATCIYKELISLPSEVKRVILYSDTCGGQNKNSHISTMFLTAIQDNKNLEIIDHKFMVRGHSHLECDSCHGKIEQQKKRLQLPAYGPQDWYQMVRATGPPNNKYQVTELNHQDFLEFSSLLKDPLILRKKDSEGCEFSWLKAKWFRYTKTYGVMLFKNSLKEDEPFKEFSFVRRGRRGVKSEVELKPKKCYTGKLPISEKKKMDLVSILNVVPPSYHEFYLGLVSSKAVPEILPDIEEFIEN